jgi:ATP-dependent Clp endopeptidase proteolytic subunit ClpP
MKWYQITNKAEKSEVWIYEMIGKDFWTGDGVTAKDFQKELSDIKSSQIDLHINSPGGDVFDGITIYNLLKQHSAKVTTYIDGLAASIASVIALSGDRIVMAENAMMMIHNPWGMAMGDASDMRKMADSLDKVRDSIAKTYVSKTGKRPDEINPLMDAETWMSADEALELGFIDEVSAKMDIAACVKFVPAMAKAGFKKIPDAINPKQTPTAKDAEKALRDVGFSVKAAKTILAKGMPDDLRDVDHSGESPQTTDPLRDVEEKKPGRKDRVSDLLTRAELVAPATA